jgi:ankyrin repeat protein
VINDNEIRHTMVHRWCSVVHSLMSAVLDEFARAIEQFDRKTVESLISSGSVDVNALLPRANAPPALVHAAQRGSNAIVDLLLQSNALVDDTDKRGWTACHAAAWFGDVGLLALLLAHKPNLDIVDESGRSAFNIAVSRWYKDNGRCATTLLEAGAPPDLIELSQDSLCRFAAMSVAAIKVLLACGVAVCDLSDDDGDTPLHLATRRSRDADVFEMLVNVCRVDLEARNLCGRTCAHLAAGGEDRFALHWLVAAGANLNCTDEGGSTPLHYARRFQACGVPSGCWSGRAHSEPERAHSASW